jgi:hypothetical protein
MSSKRKYSDVIDLTSDENDKNERKATKKEEKRAARLVSRASSKTLDRIQRALSQRLYLISQKDLSVDGNLRRDYAVLGSTGNVYDVTISRQCTCTCPDSVNLCKHILFVFLRVLKVHPHSHVVYQNALLQSELASIFASKANHDDVIAKKEVQKAYNKSLGITVDDELNNDINNGIPTLEEGAECPICFEEMKDNHSEKIEHCQTCRKYVHFDCMSRWKKNSNTIVTCPLCRQPWAAGQGKVQEDEGYLNLRRLQGQSSQRDTSTYHNRFNQWDDY